jgi:hypothetical protein
MEKVCMGRVYGKVGLRGMAKYWSSSFSGSRMGKQGQSVPETRTHETVLLVVTRHTWCTRECHSIARACGVVVVLRPIKRPVAVLCWTTTPAMRPKR